MSTIGYIQTIYYLYNMSTKFYCIYYIPYKYLSTTAIRICNKCRCIIVTVSCLQIRWLGFYRQQIDTKTKNPRNPIIHVSFSLLRSNHDYLSRKQCTYYPSLHKLHNIHFCVRVKFKNKIMTSSFRVYYFSPS